MSKLLLINKKIKRNIYNNFNSFIKELDIGKIIIDNVYQEKIIIDDKIINENSKNILFIGLYNNINVYLKNIKNSYVILNDDIEKISKQLVEIVNFTYPKKIFVNSKELQSKLLNSEIINFDDIRSEKVDEEINEYYFKSRQNYDKNINLKKLEELQQINLNEIKNNINLILDFPLYGGGSVHFLDSILHFYKKYNNFILIRKNNDKYILTFNDDKLILNDTKEEIYKILQKININKIFINHLIEFELDFYEKITNLSSDISLITHDHYILTSKINILNLKGTSTPLIDLSKIKKIFTQNIKNKEFFKLIYPNNKFNFKIAPLIDFKSQDEKIICDKPVIGLIGNFYSEIKGINIIKKIYNKLKNKYKFFVFGKIKLNIPQKSYKNIYEFNELLKLVKPTIWLSTSIWMETYSYTTTLKKITTLPVLIYKNEFPSVIANRLENYDYFSTIDELNEKIPKLSQKYLFTIKPKYYSNEIWDNYFIETTNKIKPNIYPIYFPQFHEIPENNISFYKGFTDIENLKLLKLVNKSTDIPLKKYWNINNYSLLNNNLLNKQIKLIKDYKLSGFAMYFYWFSTNTITNKYMIFDKVINKFFNEIDMFDKKIFFIWANENWTSNPAFGNTTEKIETEYSNENINILGDTLIKYFKSNKYLKINNKPLLFIHHPNFINNINNLYDILNEKCINNGFDGLTIKLNDIYGDENNNFEYYSHSPNYKSNKFYYYDKKLKKNVLNYKLYLENTFKNRIQTMFFNFDNSARLIKPDKYKLTTICVNNSEKNKTELFRKILDIYKKNYFTDDNNILLINAFNEWGEGMFLEPSKNLEYENIKIIKNGIKKF